MANTENKRTNFTWKTMHEDILLREVLVVEPYQYRQGSKEKGSAWTKIAENFTNMGIKASQRSVREKFEKLVKDFKRKEAMEERASGVDVDYTERDQAMWDILERMHECEVTMESNKEKEMAEKATADDMKKKAKERYGETRRRHSEANEDLVTPERKRIRNSDVMEVLKGSIEIKQKEQEQAKQFRERELILMEKQPQRQEEFQKTMI